MSQISHEVTDSEKELIKSGYWRTLCQWYSKLNNWEWPEELLPCDDGGIYLREGRRSKLMRLIENRVGDHTILRVHNESRMTADEFEDFWQGTKRGDKTAEANYNYRTMKRIAKGMNIELKTIHEI